MYCHSIVGYRCSDPTHATINEFAADVDRASGMRELEATVDRWSNAGRFCKLNLSAYFRHGTVEFRHHGGTLNATKIEAWLRMVDSMLKEAIEQRVFVRVASHETYNEDRWTRLLLKHVPGRKLRGFVRARIAAA